MAENSKTVGNIVVWHGPHCKKTCIPLENKITEIWLLLFFSGSKNNIKVYKNMYVQEKYNSFADLFICVKLWEKGDFENGKTTTYFM